MLRGSRIEELEKRWAETVAGEREREHETKRLLDIQRKQDAKGTQPSPKLLLPSDPSTFFKSLMKEQSSNVTQPTVAATKTEAIMEIIDKLRKWGISFDGTGDPLEFIERVEKLSLMNGVTLDLIPQLMPELLRDRALIWFRNNNNFWSSWNSFKIDLSKFFLPPRSYEKLEDEIQNRKQLKNENFKDYLVSIQNLMTHCKWTESQKLEIIYKNCLPDYQFYIKKKYFSCLEELVTLAEDLESFRPTCHEHNGSSNNFIDASTYRGQHNLRRPNYQTSANQTALRCEEFRITATIIIGKKLITSTIDTGATRNFIKTDFLRQFKGNFRKVNENLEVILADGSRKEITEGAQFNVTFGNATKSCIFFILADFFEDMILGLDFLRTFNTTLNCAGFSLDCEFQNTPTEPTNDQIEINNKKPISVVSTQQGSGKHRTISQLSPEPRKIIRDFLETELPKCSTLKNLKRVVVPMPKSYASRWPINETAEVPLCPIPTPSLVNPVPPKIYTPSLPSPHPSSPPPSSSSPSSTTSANSSLLNALASAMSSTTPALPPVSPAVHHTLLPSPPTLIAPEPCMGSVQIPNTIMKCVQEALKRRKPNERIRFLKTEKGVKYQIRVARSGSYIVKVV